MIKINSEKIELYFEKSELIIYMNKLELFGDVKDAAMGLFKITENYMRDSYIKSIQTRWADTLIAYHDSGKITNKTPEFTLYYIGEKPEPEFFKELKKEYERIFKLKIFI